MSDKTPETSTTETTKTAAWVQVLTAFRWPLALVGLAVVAFLFYRETLERADKVAAAAVEGAAAVAKGLLTGNVTEEFLASIPEFDPEGSGNLEVATITATETFAKSDERRVLWDWLSLGVTESEIRVPVTYRYHVRLADAWQLEIVGSTCWVWAPTLRPSLPPAIHTDRLQKRSAEDWLRFDGADQMAELERSMTPTLSRFAADERHLALVREPARRAVEDFVRDWLLREGQWGIERVHAIEVVFPGEDVDVGAPEVPPLPPPGG